MFRFTHGADIHLESPLCGLAQYETALKEAIRDACRLPHLATLEQNWDKAQVSL